MSSFATTAALDVVRYSQVWEDHAVLERGLHVGPGDDVLSIGSAGCNVLALLLAEPRSIVAIDVSPAQVALIELKLAALERLRHHEFAALVGARQGMDRDLLYARVRGGLGDASREYWDANVAELRAGVIGRGMLDRYIREFQREHVSRVVDPVALARLLALDDLEAQSAMFARHLGTPRFEDAVRRSFGREALSGPVRDRTQFEYVDRHEDVAGAFWRRLRHVCTALPARGNFYLEWLLTGRYGDLAAGPPFLRPENYDRLRALVDRVTVVRDRLDEHLLRAEGRPFSKANLSDVFEYMSSDEAGRLLELVASRTRPGGRVAYWNLFVARSAPERLADRLVPRAAEAHDLWLADRVPFYGSFHVDEVVG